MAATPDIFPAGPEHSRQIAELYWMAAGGVADYLWTGLAKAGEGLLDVGERRFRRSGEAFSFKNCTMAAVDGTVAGMLHAFPMTEATDPDDDFGPVLRPFAELEDEPSLYIAGIACYPDRRGQGIGQALLAAFAARYAAAAMPAQSLIAFEANAASVRLYERFGFATVDRRAIVPHELIHYSGDALLMVRAN
ncbi:MAG: GNAT family N-acetyltransferase [Rhodospirillaceae bacterium]